MMQVINSTSDILYFGKYKGKTVLYTMHDSAEYLIWCRDNHIIKMEPSLEELVFKEAVIQLDLRSKKRRSYLEALDNMNYPPEY